MAMVLITCRQPVNRVDSAREVHNVKVQAPLYMEFSDPVRTSGILTTRSEMKLSFKTGGIVSSVNVKEGQVVKEGTLLAAIDPAEINAHVSQADIAFEKSRRDYNRALNLYRDSVVTLETLQNAKSAYDLSRAQKRITEFNLKHSKIVAPAKGKVQKIVAKKNEMIAPGYPAILFATTENDWIVRVSLTDKDIVKFSTGDSASIHLDAFPGKLFSAEVSELGAISDPVTGTYDVELLLKEEHPEFRTGFIARTELFPSDSIGGWWVPFEALQNLENGNGTIFIADSARAVKREVVTGKLVGQGILIVKGIEATDRVIVEGAGYLKENDLVRVSD